MDTLGLERQYQPCRPGPFPISHAVENAIFSCSRPSCVPIGSGPVPVKLRTTNIRMLSKIPSQMRLLVGRRYASSSHTSTTSARATTALGISVALIVTLGPSTSSVLVSPLPSHLCKLRCRRCMLPERASEQYSVGDDMVPSERGSEAGGFRVKKGLWQTGL